MPVITPVPITVPAHEEHGVAVLPARNWSAPTVPSTDNGAPRVDAIAGADGQPSADAGSDAGSPTWIADGPTSEKAQAARSGPLAVFYFDLQRADLEVAARAKADSLDPAGQCYLVLGHADPSGPPRLVGPLSVERAQNVAKLLRDSGAARAEPRGVGAAEPPADKAQWPAERRAEVLGENCDTQPTPK